jgi:WD40 repeat protein
MHYSLIKSKTFESMSETKTDFYVINLCLNRNRSQLAVNLSNLFIEIIDSNTLQTITRIKDLENMNRVIKYSPQNDNHIIVSTFESINVYDLRHNSNKISKQFKIHFLPENDFKSEELDLNHIQCFDFNCDYNYLVAGTELCEDKNVYLYFWDIRKPAAVLGAYYESHTNDMT